MRDRILIIPIVLLLLAGLNSCNSGSSRSNIAIPSDSITIAKGEASFMQNCSGCHNFRHEGIGPSLGGLTAIASPDWIGQFIRNPKMMIESGDERATQLFKKYKVAMPSFVSITDDELNGIIAFLHTHKNLDQPLAKGVGNESLNPLPDSIRVSNLVVGMEMVTQIPPSSENGKLPLTRITKLDFEPQSGRTFVLDLRGKLYLLQNKKATVYMDMAKLKPAFIHEPGLGTGFGSFAFHPDFAKNGLLYTTHAEAAGSGKADFDYADSIKVNLQWVLTEWKADHPGASTFTGTSRQLFRVNMVYVIHGIQEIAFNSTAKPGEKDYGMLYLGMADGGSVEKDYPFLTHSLEKIWGTILRIDPAGRNSANGQYGIPPDNPFEKSQNAKTLGEIYAYGFKNPHRISWSKAGQLLVCNIGENYIESINKVMPGQDYGWPLREGTFVFDAFGDFNTIYPLPANDSIYNISYPIAEYDHDWGFAAIAGGFEYGGAALPPLAGKYLFGDIPSGRLFYIEMADVKEGKQAPIKEVKLAINGVPKTMTELCGTERADLHVGRDAKGELYLLTKTDGKVYKLTSVTVKK